VKAKPAVGCTLPLGAIFTDRASASQAFPRSIAAQAPPAKTTVPRASTGLTVVNAVATKTNRAFMSVS
jgi:hypothetical protein